MTLAVAVPALLCLFSGQVAAQRLSEDATMACGRAASGAERDWQIPAGLLAAIGVIESGRRTSTSTFPIIWPWTINAEGRGFYQPSKISAIGMVRALQLRGVRFIDVGCFQVDLFYHPDVFTSLEEAFDPDANARAAARILRLGRLSSTGWDGAIAAYHSAVPLIGAFYLQKVRAVWPVINMHPTWAEPEPPEPIAVLLSAQARLVRVVTPGDPVPVPPEALPRGIPTSSPANLRGIEAIVQWLHQPVETLPRVLLPIDPQIQLTRTTTR